MVDRFTRTNAHNQSHPPVVESVLFSPAPITPAVARRVTPPMTDSALELTLLGPLSVKADGKPLVCTSRKALWLAAYVLLQKVAQPRSKLSGLFWGDTDARALGSLRVALTKLPVPLLACLDIQREHISVAADARYVLDVDALVTDCNGLGLAQWQACVSRFGGDLFADVTADEAPNFFDWLQIERARLRQLAHNAHVMLARGLRERGQTDAARNAANRWLAHHPADETMHQMLITWLAEDAGSDQALAQYDAYRRVLAVTEGKMPPTAMLSLAERLRGRPVSARGAGSTGAMPARLAPATSFVGRETELATIQQSLDDPACRLLTLHGMGGAGKTRLALAALDATATRFSDGVFVAALDEVHTPALFAQTLARACGLQPAGAATPMDLLTAFFQRRHALLLLDNLEHLLNPADDSNKGIAAMIASLLASTSARFKILTTSREPLKLQEEWIQELHGLAFPTPGGVPKDEPFAAMQLFSQRARQVNAAFSIDVHANEVAEIAFLLEGLPLGLELAASWSGSLSPGELLAELRVHATRMASQHVNRVARHRSLGAAVAFSWDQLPAELRQTLAGVSVLTGTFSTEAAASIASATPAMLTALADKALITRTADGRWHTHEVVRQFAWEQIAHAPAETITRRRDAYYMHWLAEIGARLNGPGEPAALFDIDRESANLRAAWTSSAQAGNLDALEMSASAWFDFLECRNYVADGIAAAERWIDAARTLRNAPKGKGTSGAKNERAARALYYLGLFQRMGSRNSEALSTLQEAEAALDGDAAGFRVQIRTAVAFTLTLLGQLAEAEEVAQSALARARDLGDASLQSTACRVLGLCLLQSGRGEEGRERQREALAFATETGRPTLLAAAHNNLALAENHIGNYAAAETGYRSALGYWHDLQWIANIGRGLHNLGVVSRRCGDHAEALKRYREALEVLRKSGDRNVIALNLMSTGDALLRLGQPAEAREVALQALEMAERDGHMLPALHARIVLAQATTQQGEHKEAARHLAIVLDAAFAHQHMRTLAEAIVTAARLTAAAVPAMREEALGWAREIAATEEGSASIRDDAEAFIASLDSTYANNKNMTGTPHGLPALAAEARQALRAIEGHEGN